jgi:hypothetical protein
MFWRRSDEQLLESVLASCDTVTVETQDGVMFRRPSGVLRAVVKELRSGDRRTRMNATQILAILAVIIDLIQEIGPVVVEIVRRIREMRS